MGVTHGKFDASYFNIEALRNYYGNGEIVIEIPLLVVIFVKKPGGLHHLPPKFEHIFMLS